jgi:hypothetical protein
MLLLVLLIFNLYFHLVQVTKSHPRILRVPSVVRGNVGIAPRSGAYLVYVDQVKVV